MGGNWGGVPSADLSGVWDKPVVGAMLDSSPIYPSPFGCTCRDNPEAALCSDWSPDWTGRGSTLSSKDGSPSHTAILTKKGLGGMPPKHLTNVMVDVLRARVPCNDATRKKHPPLESRHPCLLCAAAGAASLTKLCLSIDVKKGNQGSRGGQKAENETKRK